MKILGPFRPGVDQKSQVPIRPRLVLPMAEEHAVQAGLRPGANGDAAGVLAMPEVQGDTAVVEVQLVEAVDEALARDGTGGSLLERITTCCARGSYARFLLH